MRKRKYRLLYSFLIFLLTFSWLFSGWPVIWDNPRIPPKIHKARAATTGAVYPTLGETAAESPWLDNDWVTPTNVYFDDAATANVVHSSFDNGDQTYVLKATGFDFSAIPDGSTINGVIVNVNAWNRSGQGTGSMDLLQLLDTSKAKVGTNQCSTAVALTTTDTTVITKGGSTNTWGNSLTAAWVKNANFGVAIGIIATAANADVDVDYVTIEIYYTPPPTTTVGNGASEPSNTTLGPGDGIIDLDNFTLVTNTGTDTVTAAVVTLGPANAYNNIAQVDITDSANTAKCTAVTNPASNTVSFSTCNISVGVGATAYKVRITPKAHADMPAVPGGSYATTGTVTDITCTNGKSLGDSGSATVTVDNASPVEVTGTSGTSGNQQVQLNWTNPGDSDFAGVAVLRRDGSAVGDAPTEGSTYVEGNTIGSSTVACVEISSAITCTDTGLTNGTAYHYKIFTKDSRGNYDAGTVPTSSPFTPQVPLSISLSTNGSVAFGYLGVGVSADTTPSGKNDIEVISVDSGPANLEARSTAFTAGGDTWTLGAGNGASQVKWEFSPDTSSWTTMAVADNLYSLANSVGTGVTQPLYLRLTMPTSTNSYNEHSATVTVVASTP